jgi:predicted O-methyltransferase YrrM
VEETKNRLKNYKKRKINNPKLRKVMLKSLKFLRKDFDFKDRDWLYKKIPKGSVCAEIGVYMGNNSLNMLKIIDPKELILIDPWLRDTDMLESNFTTDEGNEISDYNARYEYTKQLFRNNKNIKIIRGKSQIELTKFPDEYFDFIYIDGDHSFEGALGDLKIAFEKTKSSGIIAGDDYRTGPKANSTQKNVARAVEEFVKDYSVKLVAERNIQFMLIKD